MDQTPTPHVLIVDDDREIRELLSRFLARNACRVSVAREEREMRKIMQDSSIDLLVLDAMLPGKDGFTICRELRAIGDVPIIMLTAAGDETDRIVGLEMGADDYVAKPFNPRELLARAADEFGRDVNAAPVPESGARELRQATHALNLMQARLQRFVQDRVQMTAAISHDLRTPITRLRLRAEFVDDDEQRRRMLADLAAMESMIDATLAFARQDSVTEAPAKVDLVSLLEDVCEGQPEVTLHRGAGADSRLPFVCRPVAVRRCLAIARSIARAHGGDVVIANRPEGGLRAVLTLPA